MMNYYDPQTLAEAKLEQKKLQSKVILTDDLPIIRSIAGADLAYFYDNQMIQVAVGVLKYPELTVMETVIDYCPVTFPYIPGYLSFREIPAILKAFYQLNNRPDIICCDGQGYAHPRRFGLACHLGVLLDIPTIGVAKSRLIGTHQEVGENQGDSEYLYDQEEIIGMVLRTRNKVKPLYISTGHRVSLATAKTIVLNCCTRYRLPETTRLVDRLSREGR